MEKIRLTAALTTLAILFLCIEAYPEETSKPKSHMAWRITGVIDNTEVNYTCVNNTLRIYVMNRNVRRPLDHVLVQVIYNNKYAAKMMTPYTGLVEFIPKEEGIYTIKMERQNYFTEWVKVNLTLCSTTTTTSTTSSTKETTTSTTPTTSTTSTSSTTSTQPIIIEEKKPGDTCSDGIQNMDEEGIDCGGVCSKPCSRNNSDLIFPAAVVVILVLTIVTAVFLLTKTTKNKDSEKHKQHQHKKPIEKKNK